MQSLAHSPVFNHAKICLSISKGVATIDRNTSPESSVVKNNQQRKDLVVFANPVPQPYPLFLSSPVSKVPWKNTLNSTIRLVYFDMDATARYILHQ